MCTEKDGIEKDIYDRKNRRKNGVGVDQRLTYLQHSNSHTHTVTHALVFKGFFLSRVIPMVLFKNILSISLILRAGNVYFLSFKLILCRFGQCHAELPRPRGAAWIHALFTFVRFSDIQFDTMFIQINVRGIVFVLSCSNVIFDRIHFAILLNFLFPLCAVFFLGYE